MAKRLSAIVFAAFLAAGLPSAVFSAEGGAPVEKKQAETKPVEAKQAETKQAESAGFSVGRLVVGTGIENREPVGAAEVFPASTQKAYCFLEATVIPEDTKATFVWRLSGREVSRTEVSLKKGPRWRTHAYKTLNGQKGDWKVEVLSASGGTVGSVSFKVE